jgi:preprotein translocase subunit SecD
VQVQEAVSQETDQTLDHITTLLRDKGIRYDEIRKLSDTQILVHNIAPEQAGTARNLIVDQFPDWNRSPAPGEASGYVLTMSPSRSPISSSRPWIRPKKRFGAALTRWD